MNQYLLEAAATSSTKASMMRGHSQTTRWSIGLIAAFGLTAPAWVYVTTWLAVTDSVTVSDVISTADAEVLLRSIGTVLIDLFGILVAYL
jgi:hypothetical protein